MLWPLATLLSVIYFFMTTDRFLAHEINAVHSEESIDTNAIQGEILEKKLRNEDENATTTVTAVVTTIEEMELAEEKDEEQDVEEVNYRLPNSVMPVYYTLKIVTFLEENFTYSGEVRIVINATEETNNITLHYSGLEIPETPKVTALFDPEYQLEVQETTYDNVTEMYTLYLNDSLQKKEQYEMQIFFIGSLSEEEDVGFYRVNYTTTEKQVRWIAVTQFQATYARRAFPCFDEPALKARFQINIAHSVNFTSVSNMPLINTSDPDMELEGKVWDRFEETPPMSTYLIAFVVSDLKNLSASNGKYSIWVQEENEEFLKNYTEVLPRIVEHMENFTGIQYGLPKLDSVAIPHRSFSAMENWGLIIYDESGLIAKEDASANDLQDALMLITHETAHQWFGNLVSPVWWDYLFLNEGFAAYFEYMMTAKLKPEWRLEDQILVKSCFLAMEQDIYNVTHPVIYNMLSPNVIEESFDAITYDKGACVIRMMEQFLTHQIFQRGLSRYLKIHSYSSVEADDLYRALNEQKEEDTNSVLKEDVKTIMDSWTLQTGYPVIHVKRIKNGIELTQERFTMEEFQDVNATWWVPITYTLNSQLNFSDISTKVWLKGKQNAIHFDNFSDTDWIILNIQARGYYRVHYDLTSWSLIAEYLKSSNYTHIHLLNRAQLINDAFTLAEAGQIDYTVALDVSSFMVQETDYIVWQSYLTVSQSLYEHLYGTTTYDLLKKYMAIIANKTYELVEYNKKESDQHITKLTREAILPFMCTHRHEDCVAKAAYQFKKWMASPGTTVIPKYLNATVLCAGIRNGTEREWQYLWNQYEKSNYSSEDIKRALGCSENKDLLYRYINHSIFENPDEIPLIVYFIIAGSSNGVDVIFSYLVDNFQVIYHENRNASFFGTVISALVQGICREQQLGKIKLFVAENGFNETAEEEEWFYNANKNIDWLKENEEGIKRWLKLFIDEHST